MTPETTLLLPAAETRPIRLVRAITWLGILIAAFAFWLIAGWMAWEYLRP